MARLRFFAFTAVVVGLMANDALAQRRGGGGAVSTGVRGAMVGGLVGGEGAAAKGAKVGAVVGATRTVVQSAEQRNAISTETQARTQYQTTAEYQAAPHSDFSATPPEVLAATPAGGSAAAAPAAPAGKEPVETVIRKAGKPALGITYPADWKLKVGERHATAVTPDGQGWSVIALLDGVKDKEAGIAKAKEGLAKSFQDLKYDEATETERGALVVTGTGKAKKSGAEVVFAVGIFESGMGQLAGAAFIVDKNVEDHYKETVRFTCGTIRGEKGFAESTGAGN